MAGADKLIDERNKAQQRADTEAARADKAEEALEVERQRAKIGAEFAEGQVETITRRCDRAEETLRRVSEIIAGGVPGWSGQAQDEIEKTLRRASKIAVPPAPPGGEDGVIEVGRVPKVEELAVGSFRGEALDLRPTGYMTRTAAIQFGRTWLAVARRLPREIPDPLPVIFCDAGGQMMVVRVPHNGIADEARPLAEAAEEALQPESIEVQKLRDALAAAEERRDELEALVRDELVPNVQTLVELLAGDTPAWWVRAARALGELERWSTSPLVQPRAEEEGER
jgi:hypothetical protein